MDTLPCPRCLFTDGAHAVGCPNGPTGTPDLPYRTPARARDASTLPDLVGRLAPDEPVFVLRGQDVLAPLAIQQYAEGLRRAGRDEQAAEVEQRGIDFLRWQAANRHRVKLPD